MDLWDSLYLPQYEQIRENEFSCRRRHTKQKEEDIVICDCKLDPNDPESACGERCLNVLTSTECTPGYCPCVASCKNQKFQNCEYAKTKLFRTEGRGWGLAADEDIKSGTFIIEYCGEVISWREARRRSQTYETLGITDAYIISLNSMESIDATRKGSLARFMNHSCWPNCETRKWTVLGEIRVGIFSKEDIPKGTELAYDYNFEWFGGAKVRCLCGAATCCGFLGAKSRGFQEDTYLWEDDDDRYSVEKIPLYDSAEDEAGSKGKLEGGCGSLEPKKKRVKRRKKMIERQLDGKQLAKMGVFRKEKEELLGFERRKKEAASELACLYNEIRPAIEEHERDRQDSVATALAEKWIRATCIKLKTDFDFYSFVVKKLGSYSFQTG